MAGMLTTRSDVILRPQLFITSAAAKSFHPPARVCFRRDTNTLLSSPGVYHRPVLSVPPHKLNYVNYYDYNAPDSYLHLLEKKINKPFVVNNNQQSVIINSNCDNKSNSSSSTSVTNKLVEIRKTVVNALASLLLFGFLAFMNTATFKTSAFAASLSSNSGCKEECNTSRLPFAKTRRRRINNSRVFSVSPTIVSNKNENISEPTRDLYEELWIERIAKIVGIIVFIIFAPLTIPLFVAIIAGCRYYFALCKDTAEKSVFMLQVGVLDNTRELQREVRRITQVANTSNLNEVVKALLQHYDSCRFAYLSVTQCLSDEKKNGNNFAELMDSIDKDDEALIMVYYLFKSFAKSLANFMHSALVKAIKKINYGDKCSKQLFAEVLTRELARYDKYEETLASVDGLKCKAEADGKAHRMVDSDYLVVTILMLASGVYSIPPLQCNTEHVKNVLQKLSTIPKSKIESLQVLLIPQTEDEGVSEQGLYRNFPLLKPLTPTTK